MWPDKFERDSDPDAPAPEEQDFEGWENYRLYYINRDWLGDPTPVKYYHLYMRPLWERSLDGNMAASSEERAEILGPVIEEMFTRKVWLPAAGEWQICAATARLTGALTRLKRYEEALPFLERYFALPPEYKTRSTASDEATLQKRLESCRKHLRTREA